MMVAVMRATHRARRLYCDPFPLLRSSRTSAPIIDPIPLSRGRGNRDQPLRREPTVSDKVR